MNVPWEWIKQRPHFIAEGLSEHYKVQIMSEMTYRRKQIKNETNHNVKRFFKLPFGRFSIINKINKILYIIQLRLYIKRNEIIWITSPDIFNFISEKDLINKKVIYDCMDNYIEFPAVAINQSKKENIILNEGNICKRSDVIFFSSEYLQKVLCERYGIKNKSYVVNNALVSIQNKKETNVELPNSIIDKYINNSNYKIIYIGTISRWFDFDLIKDVLDRYDKCEIFLFGPTEVELPAIERLTYMGTIEHNLIFKIMDEADILIMPFIINELIKSVNPVKLYEYIYTGKPIIAPLYGESLKFEPYVYLYSTNNECVDLIDEIIKGDKHTKKSKEECILYCKSNTWKNRIENICSIIDNKLIVQE